ncbi:hypothetical protein YPPY103_2879 [Yersinia pestis PY-103]|nr:hypothetical protein YPPY103_2879 [Yersinia pestis PY-103]
MFFEQPISLDNRFSEESVFLSNLLLCRGAGVQVGAPN